ASSSRPPSPALAPPPSRNPLPPLPLPPLAPKLPPLAALPPFPFPEEPPLPLLPPVSSLFSPELAEQAAARLTPTMAESAAILRSLSCMWGLLEDESWVSTRRGLRLWGSSAG